MFEANEGLNSRLLVISSEAENECFTREVLSLVVSLVRQREVSQHVLDLPLGLGLRATFQQRVEEDVLLHRQTVTASTEKGAHAEGEASPKL